MIHRDIKLENILLHEGETMLADFGISLVVRQDAVTRLTEAGLICGTPAYMSPEQAEGGQLDGRSDQCSLATVLHEMLAGEPPFTGLTPQAVTRARLWLRCEVDHRTVATVGRESEIVSFPQ